MQTTQYTCDACKMIYNRVTVEPVKRGEVIKQLVIRVYDIQHPKDVQVVYFSHDSLLRGLDLCIRCEETIKRFLNL